MKATDIDRTPVAKDIITVCTKCNLELNHIVVRHNTEGIVDRVKCHTCGSEHKYKPVSKKKAASATPRKRTVKKKSPEKEYEKLLKKYGDREPVPYNIKASFSEGDLIVHKTFGTGIVSEVSFQRIDVVFPEGMKALAAERD